jgi:hypothetical protein
MKVRTHVQSFAGRPVESYSTDDGVQNVDAAIRIAGDYENDVELVDLLDALREDEQAPQIKALILGMWSSDTDDPADPVYEKLVEPETVAAFSSLTALFVGDITGEEQNISDINQADIAPVMRAYPALRTLRIRGGFELALNGLDSDALETLIVETGGLSRDCIAQVCAARLPNLEHLELWLGSERYNYGKQHTIDDVMPILSGRLFPKLRHLALRDCEYTDELARALADAPVLSQLDTLDLSMGTLGDEGANALIASPQVKKLKQLDVSHHYMSPAVAAALAALGPTVIAKDAQGAGDERYVQVAE